MKSAVAGFLGALLTLVLSAQLHAAAFQGLGYLVGGQSYSEAHAVSGDGTTIVGVSGSPRGDREAFRWTAAGGMAGLGALSVKTFYSDADAVSQDGAVVVGYSASASGNEAFRWTAAGGMTGLGDLPGGVFSSRATGVSADGSVVAGTGNYSPGGGPSPVTGEAFRWTQTTGLVGLGDVRGGTGVSRAFDLSADGAVIAGKGNAAASFQVENLGVAYRWTAADGMVPLGFLPGGADLSIASAVSANGSVVVGYSRTTVGGEAFRWQSGEMRGLGTLADAKGTSESFANAVSADGRVIIGKYTSASDAEAFVWDEVAGVRRLKDVLSSELGLNLAGWRLQEATDISDDGRVIVGYGKDPSGNTEAWRAEIPPNLAWNGAATGDNRWTSPANWSGAVPMAGAYLNFGAVASGGHAGNHNDFVAGTQFGRISFTVDAPSYNLQGNPITLTGSVTNQSSQDQAISLDLGLASGGGLFDLGGRTLTVAGQIDGVGPLIKAGAGTLVLSHGNLYTRGTEIRAGTLLLTAVNALLPGGSLTIGAGSTVVLGSGLGVSARSATAVPEPSALALVGMGVLGLLARRRRTRGPWAANRPIARFLVAMSVQGRR